jgi:hypothetical protein
LGEAIIAQEKLFAQKFFTRYDGGPINQLEYRMSEGFQIKAAREDAHVFVNRYDEGLVWLSLYVKNGNVNTVMTKAQAKELIAALEKVVA